MSPVALRTCGDPGGLEVKDTALVAANCKSDAFWDTELQSCRKELSCNSAGLWPLLSYSLNDCLRGER